MKKEDFFNTKIRVKNEAESIKIQNKLFELGIGWNHERLEIHFTDASYLYIDIFGDLMYTRDLDDPYFDNASNREITIKDLGIIPNWKQRLQK